MADVVSAEAPDAAAVLVQDYHFSLLGQMLRESRPDLRTVHFCHIPFADPNMLRVLPDDAARELMAGLAGFGACGFHAEHWAEGFRACFAHAELAGSTIAPPTFVSSLSPDHEGLLAEAASPECTRSVAQLRAETGGKRIVLRVDRVEPSKNIVRGMLAFEELLTTRPEWVGAVVHLALVYPSRQGLADYLALEAEVAHTAERINHAWGTPSWTPIVLHVEDDRPRSLAASDHLRCAPGQPRTRRPQSGGQGGPAAQRRGRRAGALPGGRGLRRTGWTGAGHQPLRCQRHG